MSDVYTSSDVVSAIMTGDSSRAKEGILSILGQKSMDELEVRKAEIAQNMFNDSPVEELEASDDQEEIVQNEPHNDEDVETVEVSPTDNTPDIQIVDPHTGQPTETLEEPNLEHFGSEEFCFESWKEKNESR